MSENKTVSCHCGAVELALTLQNELANFYRCNCSLCRRKGAVMAGVPMSALRVIRGAENLTEYKWNTEVARHFFCKTCGIYTHHARRSAPHEYGVNVGCIHGFDPFALGEVTVGDGAAMSVVE